MQPNLDLSANVYANAYGMDLINTTIDLCSYLQGVLCPLPQINFTGGPLRFAYGARRV